MNEARRVVDFAESHEAIFVVGMERGGTSILQQTLSSAPDLVSWQGEFETFAFDKPGTLRSADALPMTKMFLGPGEEFEDYRRWFESLSDWPDVWIPARRLVSAYFYYASEKLRNGARVLEKTPRHALSLDLILRFFPKSKVVGILRHPFGVVESYQKRLRREKEQGRDPAGYAWLDRTPRQIVAHVDRIATALVDGQRKHPQQVMRVTYEETLRDPEFVFGMIGAFCGIDGVVVNTRKKAEETGGADVDPLLRAGGIVTGNSYESHIPLAEKLALVRAYPDVFEATTGLAAMRG